VVDDDLPPAASSCSSTRRTPNPSYRLRAHMISYALCICGRNFPNGRGTIATGHQPEAMHADWKKDSYSNEKLKPNWAGRQSVTAEAMRRYFEACAGGGRNA